MRHFGRFQSLLCMDNSPLSLHYFTLSQLLEAGNTIENLSMQDHTLLEEASKQLQRTSGSFWMHPSICDASMTCCWGLVWYPEKGLTTQKNENIRTEKKHTHTHTMMMNVHHHIIFVQNPSCKSLRGYGGGVRTELAELNE